MSLQCVGLKAQRALDAGLQKLSKRSINMKIYVGNLSSEVTEEELRQEFEAFGEVASVDIIKDKYSGQPRGFGFVEMASVSEGQAAITGLNGKTLKERILNINAARPRSESRGGWSRGDRRGGGFSGGRQRRY
jgi:RNA recognition motif-containing protein